MTQNPVRAADNGIEIDLVDLMGFYLSRLPIIIIAFVVGAVAAGLYTHFMVPSKYTATSRMYMVSASSDAVVNLSDLNLGTSISNDYVELMRTRPIVEEVIEKLELPYTYEELLSMVDMSVVSNTRIVRINAVSTDPEEAMNIANQLARTAKVQLPKVMDAPSPSIAEDAVLPTRRSSPSMSRNLILGALLATLAVVAVLTVIYLQDDTLKSGEDVEKMLGIMPLTVIPEGEIKEFSQNQQEGRSTKRLKARRREARHG